MKKVLSLFLTAVFMMTCLSSFAFSASAAPEIWDGKRAFAFAGGSGTKDDPWQISNGAELSYMFYIFNNGVLKEPFEETYGHDFFVLTKDIYLNDVSNYDKWDIKNRPANVWPYAPLGLGGYAFYETIDGQGHTIYGLYQICGGKGGGLVYGGMEGSTLQNLNLDKAMIYAESNAGALAAGNMGTIRNCHVSAKVFGVKGNFFGGVCGYNQGLIENCVFEGSVESVGIYTGGISGNMGTEDEKAAGAVISNCINYGTVTGTPDKDNGSAVGGIAGNMGNLTTKSTITNCFNAGTITGTGSVGGIVGLVGYKDDGTGSNIQNCFSFGTVKANKEGVESVGGVFGYFSKGAKTSNCYYDSDKIKLNGIGLDLASAASAVKGLATSKMQGNSAVANMKMDAGVWQNISNYYPVIKDLHAKGWTKIEAGNTNPNGNGDSSTTPTKPDPGSNTNSTPSSQGGTVSGNDNPSSGDSSQDASDVSGSTESQPDVSSDESSRDPSVSGDSSKSDNASSDTDVNGDSQDKPVIWPWILVGVIIVLGGAGFCVYFFVIKKKIFEKK